MNVLKLSVTSLIALFLFSNGAIAQDTVSDKELKQFATALQQIQLIGQNTQQQMVEAINKEKIAVDKFNEIRQAEIDPEKEADASKEDLDKYKKAWKAVKQIQIQSNTQMEKSVEKEGLTTERYQEIGAKVQADQKLMQKVQAILADN